jgi:hypothetical protein
MGWRVTYFENGEIEDETLYYGATFVYYRISNKNANLLEEGWNTPKKFYNIVAKEIGMEPLKL